MLAQVRGRLDCVATNQITGQKVPILTETLIKISFITSVTVRKRSNFSACKMQDVTNALNTEFMVLL